MGDVPVQLPSVSGTVLSLTTDHTYGQIAEVRLDDGRCVQAIPTPRSERAKLRPQIGTRVLVALSPFDGERGFLLGPA